MNRSNSKMFINLELPKHKAALEVGLTRKVSYLTDLQVAEFIIMAKDSLWYLQAKKWLKEPPKACKDNATIIIWKMACQFIVDVVDMGYNSETNLWWDYARNKTKEELLKDTLILSDFGLMLEQYRTRSRDIISRGFDTFIEIINGKNWKRDYKKALKVLKR